MTAAARPVHDDDDHRLRWPGLSVCPGHDGDSVFPLSQPHGPRGALGKALVLGSGRAHTQSGPPSTRRPPPLESILRRWKMFAE